MVSHPQPKFPDAEERNLFPRPRETTEYRSGQAAADTPQIFQSHPEQNEAAGERLVRFADSESSIVVVFLLRIFCAANARTPEEIPDAQSCSARCGRRRPASAKPPDPGVWLA